MQSDVCRATKPASSPCRPNGNQCARVEWHDGTLREHPVVAKSARDPGRSGGFSRRIARAPASAGEPVLRRGGMELILGQRRVLDVRTYHFEPFGLSIADRRQSVLLLGKTGVGKVTSVNEV